MNDLYYKKHIENLINSNPIEIDIEKEIEIPDGYGGFTVTTVNKKEIVTLYNTRGRREIVTDYGKSYTGISITKMLAKADADIVKGDTFRTEGTKYRVFFVKSLLSICKQIELEVI